MCLRSCPFGSSYVSLSLSEIVRTNNSYISDGLLRVDPTDSRMDGCRDLWCPENFYNYRRFLSNAVCGYIDIIPSSQRTGDNQALHLLQYVGGKLFYRTAAICMRNWPLTFFVIKWGWRSFLDISIWLDPETLNEICLGLKLLGKTSERADQCLSRTAFRLPTSCSAALDRYGYFSYRDSLCFQDILDALLWTASERDGKKKIVMTIVHFVAAIVYAASHALLVLFQVDLFLRFGCYSFFGSLGNDP